MPIDPDLRLRVADEILESAAEKLLGLLRESARELRPFPAFPGAFFTMGVEVEPDGVEDRDLGCVIVTEEGLLKELRIGFDEESSLSLGTPDPVSMRDETLVDPELTPHDKLVLAYNGLHAIARLLAEQGEAPRSEGS